MTRVFGNLGLAGLVLAVLCAGCMPRHEARFTDTDRRAMAVANSMSIDEPREKLEVGAKLVGYNEPTTVAEQGPPTYWDLTLQEVVHLALANSEVMRDVGGRVVNAPGSTPSIYDPAMQELDPRAGLQRALAAFDAQFTTSLFFGRNERTFNNAFFGGGTTQYEQNTGEFNAELSKTSAVGTRYFARHIINYDRNNSPNNLFRSGYDVVYEAEVRHPFLQGAGLEFNRIVGPNGQLGNFNGVVIARINSDIALTDFEIAVRQLVTDVERTYWGLYLAYRELDSVIKGRDNTLEIWKRVRSLVEEKSSRPEREALVREQYYEAQQQVENLLNGSPIQGSTQQLYNPVTAINAGVLGTERRLRFLMGVPNTDGRLIRPLDEPSLVHQVFDWDESLALALTRRVELRRQRWAITRREMELIGTRNFLLGRLDAVARFGVRGFGDQLLGDDGTPNRSAYQDLFYNRLQQWQIGFQYQTVIGNRVGHAAVRNAELQLMRERALYRDQEMQVASEVGGAFAELERAYSVSRLAFNRRIAAQQNLEPILIRFLELGERDRGDTGDRLGVSLEFLLDAQRRSTQAEAQFYRAVVDHTMAVSLMHFYRGTYLDFHNVHLAEGPWTADAHASAEREARRFLLRRHLETKVVPCPVSDGEFAQGSDLETANPEPVPTPAGDPPAGPTLPTPATPTPEPDPTLPPGNGSADPAAPLLKQPLPTDAALPAYLQTPRAARGLLLPPSAAELQAAPTPPAENLPAGPTLPAAGELPTPPNAPQELPQPAPSEAAPRPLRRIQVNAPALPDARPAISQTISDSQETIPTAGEEPAEATGLVSRIPVVSKLWGPQPSAPPLNAPRSQDPPPSPPSVRGWPFALPRLPQMPALWPRSSEVVSDAAPIDTPTPQHNSMPAGPLPRVYAPAALPPRDGHSDPLGEPRVSSLRLPPSFAGHSQPQETLPASATPAAASMASVPVSAATPGTKVVEGTPAPPALVPVGFPTARPLRRIDVEVPATTGDLVPSALPATEALPSVSIPALSPQRADAPRVAPTPATSFAPQPYIPPLPSEPAPASVPAAAPVESQPSSPATTNRGPRRVRVDP